MTEEEQLQKRCLWHTDDGRCSSCKARRIRCDVLRIKDYEMCEGEIFYGKCDFYIPKPEPMKRSMTKCKQNDLNTELISGNKFRVAAALLALNEMLRAKEADSSSLQPLIRLLNEEDVQTRRSVSWSIAKLAQNKVLDGAPLDQLVAMLTDTDEEVRANVAWSIGELAGTKIGKGTAIGPLNSLLGDANAQVRGMAAWSLGRLAERMHLADPSSIPRLRTLLKDGSPYVSRGAAWALERTTDVLR